MQCALKKYTCVLTGLLLLLCSSSSIAGDITIRQALFEREDDGLWSVSVTLRHRDKGWKHFADRWRIVDENGVQLGIRVLQHPHIKEQPFTRSLTNVAIPKETKILYIEARENKHGWSEQRLKVNMSKVVNGRLRAKP